MLVAVYGSLKKGFYNHGLIKPYKYLGTDRIVGFDMYNLGAFPGIKPGEGSISIEVYDVDNQEGLDALDRLEGYPQLYDKQIVDTKYGKAIIYVYNMELNPNYDLLVETGIWEEPNFD